MRQTMVDPVVDADLERFGFAVVPFLDADQIAQLTELYWRVGPAPDDPRTTMYFDFQSEDSGYKRKLVDELRPILEPAMDAVALDHHLFFPNYIMKWPGDRSGFAPHQDTTLVDESVSKSITIWCPLTDTVLEGGRDNGMLYVVPGSHAFVPWLRAHDPGAFLFPGTEQAIIDRLGVGISVRAGEAIVFDHRLVHFSMPNASTEPRLVIALGMRPNEAKLLHHRRAEGDRFEVYEIDDDYFIDLNPFSVRDGVPGYERVAVVDFPRPEVTPEDFERFCASVEGSAATAEGRTITDAARPAQVNADPFCFRCGRTDGLEGFEREEHGNVQYLCASCR
jgi:hypothetical protein